MRVLSALIAALAALVTSCATPIEARTDFDDSVDFTAYKGYVWVSDRPMIIAGAEVDPLIQQHVQSAVELELEQRGYSVELDPGRAQFAIAFTVGTREALQLNSYPAPTRQGWSGGPWSGTAAQSAVYREGTLAIDIFDLSLRRAVWHGWATTDVTEQRLGNPLATVTEAVTAILAHFPPGGAQPAQSP